MRERVALGAVAVSVLFVAGLVLWAVSRNGPPRAEVRAAPTQAAAAPRVTPEPEQEEQRGQPSDLDLARAAAARVATLRGEELVTALSRFESQVQSSPTFAQLERNADRYRGQFAIYTGRVLEIQDIPSENASFIRLGLDEYGQHVIAVVTLAPPGDEIVRDRRIRVYGALAGTYSYQSQAGWNLTIPRLDAIAAVLNSVPRRPVR